MLHGVSYVFFSMVSFLVNGLDHPTYNLGSPQATFLDFSSSAASFPWRWLFRDSELLPWNKVLELSPATNHQRTIIWRYSVPNDIQSIWYITIRHYNSKMTKREIDSVEQQLKTRSRISRSLPLQRMIFHQTLWWKRRSKWWLLPAVAILMFTSY